MPCQSSGVVQVYPRSREIARTVRDWQGKTGHVREGVAGIAGGAEMWPNLQWRRGNASSWRHLREPVARDILAACEPHLAGRSHVLEYGLQTLDAAGAADDARVQPD